MRVFCSNHPTVDSVHEGLCQPCLDRRKKGQQAITSTAIEWTPATIKTTFGNASQFKDGTGGYYLVNGAKGMHVHVYGGDYGVHVKIGKDAILIISVKGKFLPDGWNEAIEAVMARATGTLQTQLLAAMALILSERTGGLSTVEVGKKIAALPLAAPEKK